MRIVISRCLLGERTRYDGRVRFDPGLAGFLAARCELLPVCPEVECGLPVPREPMRLAGDPLHPRLLGTASGADRTFRLMGFVCEWLDGLERGGAHGAVLKSRSPCCALSPVPVFDPTGREVGASLGLFARALAERFPDLPAAGEEQLESPAGRLAFLARAARRAG